MKYSMTYVSLMLVVMILCGSVAANAYTTSYYATSSRLSNGRWVKVKVAHTGINEITYDELLEMGFSDPSKVCVYGYGGVLLENTFDATLPDDLPAQPVYRTDDKLLFYGESDVRIDLSRDLRSPDIRRNTYSLGGYYFLSDVSPNASPTPSNLSYNASASQMRSAHNSISVIEKEETCPAQASTRFFGPNFKYELSQTFEFEAVRPDTALLVQYPDSFVVGYMNYAWAGRSINEMMINFATNDLVVEDEAHRAIGAIASTSELAYNWKEGNMTVRLNPQDPVCSFTATVSARASIQFAAIDYMSFVYKRDNYVGDVPQLRMIFDNVSASCQFVLSGANANTKVWNVTSPIDVFGYRTVFDSETGVMKGTFEKKYSSTTTGHAYLIAFDPDKTQHKVEFAGVVANQNLHSKSSPHMLVITNKTMRESANQLAQYHRTYQGMRVYVHDQEEIFNEFSSGTPSAMAYRRLAKMFYDRGAKRFKYLLLYGAGSYDNRGVINGSSDNLLTFQNDNEADINDETRAFCSDAYFGMLNDDYEHSRIQYTPMDINVSRIPVGSVDNADAVNAKTLDYLLNPPMNSSRNRALMLCDNEDLNSHLLQTEAVCDTILALAPHVTITKSYCTLYPWSEGKDAYEGRRATVQALTAGQQFMFYTGHGKPESIASEVLWSINHAEATNYNIYPIVYMATCNLLSFDRGANMSESMLYKRNGGAIAVVSSNRTVYRDCNQVLSLEMAKALYAAKAGESIGDVYRNARNAAIKFASDSLERIYGINTLCFNMIGDPALPLNVATGKVLTTAINGNEVDSVCCYDLLPLSNNSIKGEIYDAEGNLDADFNGMVSLSIYDAPVNVDTHNQGGKDEIVTVSRDEDLLVELTVPVVAGVFDANVVIPIPSRPGIGNRIVYYAVASDNTRAATGLYSNAIVQNFDANNMSDDITPPHISEMYLNEKSFSDGDYVDSEVVVYATILPDESGVSNASTAIGMATKLILDGSKSYPEIKGALVTDINGVTTVEYPIGGLQDGLHSLTLSVADNMGNRSERTISFYVIDKSAASSLEIEEAPARTQATILLDHNFHEQPSGRLVVEDINGNVVFTKTACEFPFQWDLRNSAGELVPDGVYYGYAVLNAQKQYSSTDKIKIIVVKQ